MFQSFRFKQNDTKTKVLFPKRENLNNKFKQINQTSDFRSRFKQKKNSSIPFETNFDYEDPVIIPLKKEENKSLLKERIHPENNNNKQPPIETDNLSFPSKVNSTVSEFLAIKKSKDTNRLSNEPPSNFVASDKTLKETMNSNLALQENNFSSNSFIKQPNESYIVKENLLQNNKTSDLDNFNLKSKLDLKNLTNISESSERNFKKEIPMKKGSETNENKFDLNFPVKNANDSSLILNESEKIVTAISKEDVILNATVKNDQKLSVDEPSNFTAKHDQKVINQIKTIDVKLKTKLRFNNKFL